MESSDTNSSRTEAERWLEIAARLLEARDLRGSKRFAERAMEVDPLLEGVDEVLAVADVLLASQNPPTPSQSTDYYSILQLPPLSPSSSLKPSYRRLALLLSPQHNTHPGSELAFKLVSDAWNFLSDPSNKLHYDEQLQSPSPPSSPSPSPSPPSTFWTICPACFRAHEYESKHRGLTLLCHGCRKPFLASELPSPPPAVPGTDLYYCSWGLFPIGFPGCPRFSGAPLPPGFSTGPNPAPEHTPAPASPAATRGISVSRRGRGRRLTGRPRGPPRKIRSADLLPRAADENEPVAAEDIAAGLVMNSFTIDLDETEEALGDFERNPFVVTDDDSAMMQ